MARKSNKTAHVLNLLSGGEPEKEVQQPQEAKTEAETTTVKEELEPAKAEAAPAPMPAITPAAAPEVPSNISIIDNGAKEADALAAQIHEELLKELEKEEGAAVTASAPVEEPSKKEEGSQKEENAAVSEAPKPESIPAVEAQKAETPSASAAEAPKAEIPIAPVASTPEAPKAEAPAVSTPEASKAEIPATPATEVPKTEMPVAPAAEAPKAEIPAAPATEAPRAETPVAPAAEAPKAEIPAAPVMEQPKAETPTASPEASNAEISAPTSAEPEQEEVLELSPNPLTKPEPPAEPEPDYVMLNVMQRIVEDKIIYFMKQFEVCTCPRCKADTIALTLSGLPSKYKIVDKFAVDPLVSYYTGRLISQVTVEALKACTQVKDNPRH